MSKLTIEEIEDTNGNNNSNVLSIKNRVEKKDFLDWYRNGDIVVTQRDLDENNFLKIGKNTVIDEFRYPQAYQFFEQEGKINTRQNVLTVLDYKTKDEQSIFSIQVDDFTFFEFFFQDTVIKEHTFDKFGNITNTVDKDIGPNLQNALNLRWSVNYDEQNDVNIFYLKINRDLFCYIKDYNANDEYSFNIADYFQNDYSAIKITRDYAYELVYDTIDTPTDNELLRYELTKTNAAPSSTSTSILTKTSIENEGITEAFSGVSTSDFYGFGEDIDIMFYKNTTDNDSVVIASKETNYTDYYIANIQPDGSLAGIQKISINPINYDNYALNNIPTSIKNDGQNFIVYSRSFISQTRRDQVIFGNLFQSSSDGDTMKASGKDVFNGMIFQIFDLGTEELISHSQSINHEIFGEGIGEDNTVYTFDIISTNDRSLTLIQFDASPDNTAGSGQLDFSQTNKLINWNISEGFYNSPNNTFYKIQTDNYYTYELKNKADANIKLIREIGQIDGISAGVEVDFFYQSRISQSRIEGYNDDFYTTLLPSTNLGLTAIFTQKGFHFSDCCESENINTYMRIN